MSEQYLQLLTRIEYHETRITKLFVVLNDSTNEVWLHCMEYAVVCLSNESSALFDLCFKIFMMAHFMSRGRVKKQNRRFMQHQHYQICCMKVNFWQKGTWRNCSRYRWGLRKIKTTVNRKEDVREEYERIRTSKVYIQKLETDLDIMRAEWKLKQVLTAETRQTSKQRRTLEEMAQVCEVRTGLTAYTTKMKYINKSIKNEWMAIETSCYLATVI